MIIILSTSKTLDLDTPYPSVSVTQPRHLQLSQMLAKKFSTLSCGELQTVMSLSDKLAALNHQRYQQWSPQHTTSNSRPAVFMYHGDVYSGLDAHQINPGRYPWLQQHVRLLSGLYGALRPFDLIQPYRLEMATPIPFPPHSLYAFWADKMAQDIAHDLHETGSPVLINLASDEYARAVSCPPGVQVIQPVFQNWSKQTYKVISFYAKKARGLMTHFAVNQQIEKPDDLKSFSEDGYIYCPSESDEIRWVFRKK